MSNYYDHLKTTVLEFVGFIKNEIEIDSNTQDDLDFVANFFEIMNKSTLADHVISKVLPHRQKIQRRDVKYFTSKETRGIFSIVPEEKYRFFTDAIKNGDVSKENMDYIFDYLDTMLELCDMIQKKDS